MALEEGDSHELYSTNFNVIQWRDTFKILKTKKDFFLLVILNIFSQ